jgi:uncharacterized Zn-finger protein
VKTEKLDLSESSSSSRTRLIIVDEETILSKKRKKTRNHTDNCIRCLYEDCHSLFVDKKLYETHLSEHVAERKMLCLECDKTFLKQENYERHIQNHEKDFKKIFQCSFPGCTKRFTAIYNLRIHYRIHTGDRPFKCDLCDKSYYDRANYKYHVKTGHIQVTRDEKTCVHKGCNQFFKSKKTKALHHNKFEPECETDTKTLLDLINTMKNSVGNLVRKYGRDDNVVKEELETVDGEYREAISSISKNEYFFPQVEK